MIEKLLDEAVKPFEALLTKQRSIMFLLSSFMLSPVLFEFVEFSLANPSVADMVGKVVEVFSKVGVLSFVLMLIWVFYISPRVIYFLFAYLNKTELIRQRRSVEKLKAVGEESDDFFIENYFLVADVWRREKEIAESEIRFRLEYLEVIFSLSFLVLLKALEAFDFELISLAPIVLCALYIRESSSKNVSSYLGAIAPYKIAMARIQSINSA